MGAISRPANALASARPETMPSNNLFVALRSYSPRPGRDAVEDYTTEALRWLLEANPGLGRAYANWLLEEARLEVELSDIHWKTQVRLGTGQADLVGFAQADKAGKDTVVICEHKTWSALRDNQLDDYQKTAEKEWPGTRVVMVLVTAHQGQHTQHADARLTWRQVHGFLDRWLEQAREDVVMVQDFMDYLDDRGLGPKLPIETKMLKWFDAA